MVDDMNNDKLIGNIHLGLGELEKDVNKINKLLKSINGDKEDINLNVKLKDLKENELTKLSANIKLISDNLADLSKNAQRAGAETEKATAKMIANTKQVAEEQAKQRTLLASTKYDASGKAVSSQVVTQDVDTGNQRKVIYGANNTIISDIREEENARAGVLTGINKIMNPYNSLDIAQQKEMARIKAVINDLKLLSKQYDITSDEYKRVIAEINKLATKSVPIQKSVDEAPITTAKVNYLKEQTPESLQKVIAEHEKLIMKYEQEGKSVLALEQSLRKARIEYEKLDVSSQNLSASKENKNYEAFSQQYKTKQITADDYLQSVQPYFAPQTYDILSKKNQLDIERQIERAINSSVQATRAEGLAIESMNFAPLNKALATYNSLDVAQKKQPQNIKSIITEYEKLIPLYTQEEKMLSKLTSERNKYQTQLESILKTNRLQEVETNTVLQKEQGGSAGVLGSGDARATFIDRFRNSLQYTVSGSIFSYFSQGVTTTINTIKEFELGLNDLSRTMNNVTKKDLKDMGDYALELSKTYGITLKEVQSGMTELARAGVDNKSDLMAVSKTVALGLNTTEIKDASTMTGFLVSAVKQLNLQMSDSESILDKWNYLADKYAVKSNDFAEAIQKSGSASRFLGVGIDQLNAMVVVLGERTQASGAEIGNAIKTLETYSTRPKTQEVLESYGISVKKNATELRDFSEIISQVNSALNRFGEGSVDSNKILDALGGAWRKNWISNLAENWSEVERIQQEGVDSLGYSAKENEQVMQTYSKQVDILKGNLSELAVGLGKAGILDGLKNLSVGLKDVIAFFNHLDDSTKSTLMYMGQVSVSFVALGLAWQGVTAIFSMKAFESVASTLATMPVVMNNWNISARGLAEGQAILNLALKDGTLSTATYDMAMTALSEKKVLALLTNEQMVATQAELATVQASINFQEQLGVKVSAELLALREALLIQSNKLVISNEAQAVSQKAVDTAMKTTLATSMLLKTAMVALIAVGIYAIAELWRVADEHAKKIENAVALSNKRIDEIESDRKTIVDALQYYQTNSSEVNKNVDVKGKLVELQATLIGLSHGEAEGLDLVNGRYEDQISLLKELATKKNQQSMDERKAIAEGYKNDKYYRKETNVQNKHWWELGMGDKEVVTNDTKDEIDLTTAIAQAKQRWLDAIARKPVEDITPERKMVTRGGEEITIPAVKNPNYELDKADQEAYIEKAKKEYDDLEARQKNVNSVAEDNKSKIMKNYSDISGLGKIQNSLLLDLGRGAKATNEYEIIAFDNAMKSVADILAKYDIDPNAKNFAETLESVKNELKEIPELKGVDIDQLLNKKKLLDLSLAFRKNTDEEIKLMKEYSDAMSKATSEVDALDKAKTELDTTGKLTKSSKEALINMDAGGYANILNDPTALRTKIAQSREKDLADYRNNIKLKIEQDVGFYQQNIATNTQLMAGLRELYGKDVDRWRTATEAKLAITNSLSADIGKDVIDPITKEVDPKILNEWKADTEKTINNIRNIINDFKAQGGNDTSMYDEVLNNTLLPKLDKVNKRIAYLKEMSFDSSKVDLEPDDAKVKSENIAILADRYMALNAQMERLNGLLARNKALQDLATDKEKVGLMQQQLSIMQLQQSALHDQAEEKRRERAEIITFLQNKGATFQGEGDNIESTDLQSIISAKTARVNALRFGNQTVYDNEKKGLDELNTYSQKFYDITAKDILDLSTKYLELDNSIIKVKIDMQFLAFQAHEANSSIAKVYYDFLMNMAGDDPQKKIEATAKMQQYLINEVVWQTKELERLNSVTDYATISTDAWKKQVSDATAKLASNTTELIKNSEAMVDQTISSLDAMEQKVIDIINKGVEEQKTALSKKLQDYKDFVTKTIAERDKLYAKQDYEKNLDAELLKTSQIQRKIDAIKYDTSIEGYQKRRELEKQLADETVTKNDMVEARRREVEKNNLLEGQTVEEKNVNDMIKSYDTIYSEANKKAMAHTAVVTQSMDAIKLKLPEIFKKLNVETSSFFDTFKAFEQEYGSWVGNFAIKFNRDILPQLQSASAIILEARKIGQDPYVVADSKSTKGKTVQPAIVTNASNAITKSTEKSVNDQGVITATDIAIDQAKFNIAKYQKVWWSTNDQATKDDVHARAEALRQKYNLENVDYRGYELQYSAGQYASFDGGINKGLVTKNGLYNLHGTTSNPEWVLTNTQMYNLVSKLANNLTMSAVSTAGSTSTNQSVGDISLNVNIEGNADNNTVADIRNVGKVILTDVKKELNKLGIYR